MVMILNYPKCLYCGAQFLPGTFWVGANFCRLLLLMEIVEQNPGITARDLTRRSHLAYNDVIKALTKGRGINIFGLVPEEREFGGIRYKYAVIAGWRERLRSAHDVSRRVAV